MTDYSIFTGTGGHTSLTPPASSTSFSSPITLGTLFQVTSDNVYLKGYRYWRADSAAPGGAQKFALWMSNTGSLTLTLIAAGTVTSGALTAGAWNTALLATPIPLVPGVPYLLATGFTGNFNFSSGFWTGAGGGGPGLSNGPLSMYSDTSGSAPAPFSNNQCLFTTGGTADPAVTAPASANSSFNAWIDAIVTDTAPAGISYRFWPNMPRAYPNGATTNDTTGYTLGMQFAVSQSCRLNKIWHYSPPGVAALPSRCLIWDVTAQAAVSGTDNASPAWSGAAGSGWVSCDYTSANVTLVSGKNYKVSTFLAAGSTWFAALANYWTAGGLGVSGRAAGPLSAPNSAGAVSPGQDTWHTTTFAYPLTNTNPEVHFVDVEVTPVTAATLTGAAALAASATLTVPGLVSRAGQAHLAAVPSLAAAAVLARNAQAHLAAGSVLSAQGVAAKIAAAHLAAAPAMVDAATATELASAHLAAAAALAAPAVVSEDAQAHLAAAPALAAQGAAASMAQAHLAAASALSAQVHVTDVASAHLSAAPALGGIALSDTPGGVVFAQAHLAAAATLACAVVSQRITITPNNIRPSGPGVRSSLITGSYVTVSGLIDGVYDT